MGVPTVKAGEVVDILMCPIVSGISSPVLSWIKGRELVVALVVILN